MAVSPKDIARHVRIGRDAHERLLARLNDLVASDALAAEEPSRLDGWTRAMLITHLARNADGHRRMIEAAGRGGVAAQYAGGLEERDGAIEVGRGRSDEVVLADLRDATQRLEAAWGDTDWSGFGLRDRRTPIADLPFLRIREVELHHVDLDVGTSFDDLDPTYVRLELSRLTMLWTSRQPMGMTSLPDAVLAVSPGERLAWLTGRREIDGHPVPQLL